MIAVIGATGFIGSALTRRLLREAAAAGRPEQATGQRRADEPGCTDDSDHGLPPVR